MDSDLLMRLDMIISGVVQRVGYRHLVANIARKNNITGCIKNLAGYDVQIIAEGKQKDLERFTKEITIREFPISVEGIKKTEAEYTGEFSSFEVISGSPDDMLLERYDMMISASFRMEKKQDYFIGMQRESLGLQREILEILRDTLGELKGTRQDLNTNINRELTELREEVTMIKTALIQAGIMKCT